MLSPTARRGSGWDRSGRLRGCRADHSSYARMLRVRVTCIAYTIEPDRLPAGELAEPVPTTQSPWRARWRMLGLQITRVQTPQKGFGADPWSNRTRYENSATSRTLSRRGAFC